MAGKGGAVHVVRVRRSHVDKQGRRRDYESVYLRRTYRQEGKVKHETLANLSGLDTHVVDAVDAALKGTRLVPADTVRVVRSRPHGHVAAVWAQAKALGLPGLLGPAGRSRDLALALIVSRVVRPGSKLATLGWWSDTTLGEDLDVAGAGSDEVYSAMDWLTGRQDKIEAALARRHLTRRGSAGGAVRPVLLVGGRHALPAGRPRLLPRQAQARCSLQIEYGLLTDPAGRPVAVRVFDGNTADPTAFIEAVDTVRRPGSAWSRSPWSGTAA
jgi:hypothetical protein